MKIVMTLLVRDEEDILDHNLRYHLAQGVDFFIVMDHMSTDGTPEILDAYQRAGVAEVIPQKHAGYLQGQWVTSMASRAWRRRYSVACASGNPLARPTSISAGLRAT